MELRKSKTSDTGRIRELIESTLTASSALSPQQIQALLEDDFASERLEDTFESSDSVTLVAESTVDGGETTIGGIVEAQVEEDNGKIRWLFVDPEHRGKGIGSRLFETVLETLRQQDVERVTASTFEANREGAQFFEEFGFEQTDDRQVEIAGETFVEHVYAEQSTGTETAGESNIEEKSDAALPNTEMTNGATTATADEGQQVYIDRTEDESGTEGPFFATFTDEKHTEQFGYYCANCGSLDTAMDNMDRIECTNCSNTHASRSDEAYDDSYL